VAEARDPLRQLIDLAVYAPIGLLTLAERELPNLITTGKARFDNQVTLAKFIGKMAVRQGRKELQRRLDDAEARRNGNGSAGDAHVIEATIAGAEPVTTEPTLATVPESLPEAIIEAVAESPVLELPIEGYDSLAASQVVMRLASLTADELEAVRRHEASHRARRTILGKISQLQVR